MLRTQIGFTRKSWCSHQEVLQGFLCSLLVLKSIPSYAQPRVFSCVQMKDAYACISLILSLSSHSVDTVWVWILQAARLTAPAISHIFCALHFLITMSLRTIVRFHVSLCSAHAVMFSLQWWKNNPASAHRSSMIQCYPMHKCSIPFIYLSFSVQKGLIFSFASRLVCSRVVVFFVFFLAGFSAVAAFVSLCLKK